MCQLGFSDDFISIIKALYNKECFFVEAGDITSDYIYPRRGLKQGTFTNQRESTAILFCLPYHTFNIFSLLYVGCGLSPILFSIYILELGVRLSSLGCGIDLDGVTINNLLFADDLGLLASSEDEMFLLLRVLQSWCTDFKMEVSTLKSKVVSTSDLDFWELLTPDFCYVDCIEQLEYSRYLGIDIHTSLSTIVKGKCDKISSMAASYAKSVLNLTKTLADKVDHTCLLYTSPSPRDS